MTLLQESSRQIDIRISPTSSKLRVYIIVSIVDVTWDSEEDIFLEQEMCFGILKVEVMRKECPEKRNQCYERATPSSDDCVSS